MTFYILIQALFIFSCLSLNSEHDLVDNSQATPSITALKYVLYLKTQFTLSSYLTRTVTFQWSSLELVGGISFMSMLVTLVNFFIISRLTVPIGKTKDLKESFLKQV